MTRTPFIGKWRITEMETWDSEFIDAEEEGHFTFDEGHQGEFQFGYVQVFMDCEIETVDGKPRIAFSWVGTDERDPVTGRGWARCERDRTLFGMLFFHNGDSSWFKGKRKK